MRRFGGSVLVLGMGCGFNSAGQGSSEGTSGGDSGATTSTSTSSSTASASTSDPDTTTTAQTASAATTTSTSDTSAEITTVDTSTTGPRPACDVDDNGCDADATCDDSSGQVVCTCIPGFVGDGSTCATTPVMPTLRAELPCTGGDCFGAATCFTASEIEQAVVMAGEPGVEYAVTIAIRGVLEQKEYPGGDCDGVWCVGGDPDPGPWNTVTIEVSDPIGVYHPNAGEAGLYEVVAYDYERTIVIAAGATITATFDGNGSCSIDNSQGLVVPDVPPGLVPFDGQFLQVDLIDATIAP